MHVAMSSPACHQQYMWIHLCVPVLQNLTVIGLQIQTGKVMLSSRISLSFSIVLACTVTTLLAVDTSQ